MSNQPNAEQVYLAGLEANTQREATKEEKNKEKRNEYLRTIALNIFTKQKFARQTRNLGKAWKGIIKENFNRAKGMLLNISTWSLEKLQREIERLWGAMDSDERDRRFYAFLHKNPRMPAPLNKSFYPAEENNAAIGFFFRYWVRGYSMRSLIDDIDGHMSYSTTPPTRIFNRDITPYVLHDLTGAWQRVDPNSVQYLTWRDTNLHTIYELMFEALTRPLGSTRGGGKKKSRKAKRKSRKN